MKGQWIGTYQGSAEGKLMVNIDEIDDRFECVAYVNPSERGLPISVAYFSADNKKSKQKVRAYVNPVDPRTGYQCKWEDIKELYDERVLHSEAADVTLNIIDNKLNIDAVSNIGGTLSSVLIKPSEEDTSKILGREMSWTEFKSHISTISKSRYLFRGQKEPWRLRTSFHRRGRYRISQFTRKDVTQLHNRLSAITDHYFDLSVPEQNGSFFNLLQHHGYPTPLLDWSYSPYAAAFFCLSRLAH